MPDKEEKTVKKKFSSTILYLLFCISLLLISIGFIEIVHGALPATAPEESPAPPARLNSVVVIDAGHGGIDCGAIGKATGVHEDVLNLDVAKKLQKLLLDAGATVIMTRETDSAIAGTKDLDMEKRREIIRTSKPDIVVSIHMNFFSDTSSTGPQVFFYEKSAQGRTLAKDIQAKMNEILKPASPRVNMKGDYFILRSGEAPAVIVECGFLSNARDEALLNDEAYRQKTAEAVFEGIKVFMNRPEEPAGTVTD